MLGPGDRAPDVLKRQRGDPGEEVGQLHDGADARGEQGLLHGLADAGRQPRGRRWVFPGVDEPCIVDEDDDWVDSVLRLLLLAHRGSDSAPESPDNLKSKSLKRVHDVTT